MSIRRVVPVHEAEWRLEPAPAWVAPREPGWDFDPPSSFPYAFLLIDEQHDVATHAISTRTVRKLLNLAAVQALSQVELDYDPAAHRLLVHDLSVWRQVPSGNWEMTSRAERSAFLLRQRESQLEQLTLNGRLSLVALLEDVRVGDVVDLAWTLEPIEPLEGLRLTSFLAFAWSLPVARSSLSIVSSEGEPVRWQVHVPSDLEGPVEAATSGGVMWSMENPPVYEGEPNAPGSVWPFPMLEVSGWAEWSEVASFFASLWKDALADSTEEISALASSLRPESSRDEQIREAIRFVQEDVRYLAVDFGHGAGMLPNAAGTVLRRRFGDCKDKAVLLTALLRVLGVEASPLLVAPNWGAGLDRIHPSTAAFSHAIVILRIDGKELFVDPTFLGQGGSIESLIPPPYERGLEVRSGANRLVSIPEAENSSLTVTETFDLDRQKNGSVEQVLQASGSIAENVRAALVRDGASAFSKMRGEALQTHFPSLIPSEDPATVVDSIESNEIEVRTRHDLPTWGTAGEEAPKQFTYGAHALFMAIDRTEGPETRKLPWVLPHPVLAKHRVVVRGKCVAKPQPESKYKKGPGFLYELQVGGSRNCATFDYSWETTQSEIPPEDWPEYCRARDKAFSQAGANVSTGSRPVSWQMASAFFFVVFGLSTLGRLAGDVGSPSSTPNDATQQRVEASWRSARDAMQRQEFGQATDLLKSIEKQFTGSADYYRMLAEAAARSGELGLAQTAIGNAQKLQPADPLVDLLEAKVQDQAGDLHAARRALDSLLGNQPEHLNGLWLHADVCQRLGDTKASLRSWERFLALRPSEPRALQRYALLLWQVGDHDRADEVIAGLVDAQPTESADLLLAHANYLEATGRPEEAVEPAVRAAALAPNKPQFAARHAVLLLKIGNAPKALEVAQRAVLKFPEDSGVLGAFAAVTSSMQDFEKAGPAFEAWLEQAPNDPNAVSSYGLFLLRSGRAEAARSYLGKATQKFPGAGIVWFNYAASLRATGHHTDALAAEEKAALLMPAGQRATLIQ